jgi:hypothetical protein
MIKHTYLLETITAIDSMTRRLRFVSADQDVHGVIEFDVMISNDNPFTYILGALYDFEMSNLGTLVR